MISTKKKGLNFVNFQCLNYVVLKAKGLLFKKAFLNFTTCISCCYNTTTVCDNTNISQYTDKLGWLELFRTTKKHSSGW